MAENTKNTTHEVGVIGQTYENRKTKRIGVIESRDEKYKTLLMRDPDGKTFNVVYSTFKSDWRKYTGDNIVETSSQVEEKKEKVEKAEKKVEKVEKRKVSVKERVESVRATKEVVEDAVEKSKIAGLKVLTNGKGGICVKYSRSTVFEVWMRFKDGTFSIHLNKKGLKIADSKYEYHDKWTLKDCYVFTKLKPALDVVLTAIKPDIEEKEANKTTKEEKKNTKNTKKGE